MYRFNGADYLGEYVYVYAVYTVESQFLVFNRHRSSIAIATYQTCIYYLPLKQHSASSHIASTLENHPRSFMSSITKSFKSAIINLEILIFLFSIECCYPVHKRWIKLPRYISSHESTSVEGTSLAAEASRFTTHNAFNQKLGIRVDFSPSFPTCFPSMSQHLTTKPMNPPSQPQQQEASLLSSPLPNSSPRTHTPISRHKTQDTEPLPKITTSPQFHPLQTS